MHSKALKSCGATYMPFELDAGPIIEQDVVHVSHIDSVDDFAKGLEAVLEPEPTKLYALMQTKRTGLALDGQGLDDLVSTAVTLVRRAREEAA